MEHELHTQDAWLALGREVLPGEKGIAEQRCTPNGVPYWVRLFRYDQTRDASEQQMDCPTSRAEREHGAKARDTLARIRATNLMDRHNKH